MVLIAAAAVTGITLTIFQATSHDGDSSGHKSKSTPDGEGPDGENAFGVSGEHFRDAHETLGDIRSANGWAGDSQTRYGARNSGLSDLMGQLADAGDGVNATVQSRRAIKPGY